MQAQEAAADLTLCSAGCFHHGSDTLGAQRCQRLFHSFPKCFSSFVHTTCSLSDLVQYLAFAEVHLRLVQHSQTARLLGPPAVSPTRDRHRRDVSPPMVAFSNALNLTGMKWRESPSTTIPRFQVPSTADSSIGFPLFTRRYSGNHSCFLVLRSMICLSSAGYPTSWRWLIKSFCS